MREPNRPKPVTYDITAYRLHPHSELIAAIKNFDAEKHSKFGQLEFVRKILLDGMLAKSIHAVSDKQSHIRVWQGEQGNKPADFLLSYNPKQKAVAIMLSDNVSDTLVFHIQGLLLALYHEGVLYGIRLKPDGTADITFGKTIVPFNDFERMRKMFMEPPGRTPSRQNPPVKTRKHTP